MKTINTLGSLEDHELLGLIANRQDKLALAELYDRYRHTLGSFISRKVYQDKLVDEIFNDVMFTVWQKASIFRGDSKVSTWIFGIAHRVCMSQTRKEMKHTKNMTEAEFDELPAKASEDELDSENKADLVDQLRVATSKLGENHRDVIELTYYHGHSLVEVSEIIGCPVNTVKTRLFHARKKLKESLQQNAVNH